MGKLRVPKCIYFYSIISIPHNGLQINTVYYMYKIFNIHCK